MIVLTRRPDQSTSLDYRVERGRATLDWPLWSTTARLVVTDPAALGAAKDLADAVLDEVAAACNRFDPAAEIHRVEAARGAPVMVSAVLADLLAVAVAAASFTNGDVDPTLGSALRALGYDRDLDEILWSGDSVHVVRQPAGWEDIHLDGDVVRLPAGVELDLGATAKARAADLCAALVAEHLGVGVLVGLGGDIATAGPAPDRGWVVRVQDQPGDPACAVSIPAGAAMATSSTASRTWDRAGRELHHILDPRTGQPAEVIWRTATVVATTCVHANALTTAALVRGWAALSWLRDLGAPARLVPAGGATGSGIVTLGAWPGVEKSAA